jgi:hypothetical protein
VLQILAPRRRYEKEAPVGKERRDVAQRVGLADSGQAYEDQDTWITKVEEPLDHSSVQCRLNVDL